MSVRGVKGGSQTKTPVLFVLMPFGDGRKLTFDLPDGQKHHVTCNFDQWYEGILKPAGVDAGFLVKRADDELKSGSVTEQFWDDLQAADVVLAFLTGRNPNVFYELGLAHREGKPVLLVVDKGENVPFDIKHLRHYQYDDSNVDRVGTFKPGISACLKAIAADPDGAVIPLYGRRKKPK